MKNKEVYQRTSSRNTNKCSQSPASKRSPAIYSDLPYLPPTISYWKSFLPKLYSLWYTHLVCITLLFRFSTNYVRGCNHLYYFSISSLPLHIIQLLCLVIIIRPPKNLSSNFPTCDPQKSMTDQTKWKNYFKKSHKIKNPRTEAPMGFIL